MYAMRKFLIVIAVLQLVSSMMILLAGLAAATMLAVPASRAQVEEYILSRLDCITLDVKE